jgi:FixJ family two-component response regulator
VTSVGDTIGIIDDDPSVRRALARLLRSCGLLVNVYSSAEEFLATRNGHAYALLLVDVVMAEMGGLDMLESLAAGGTPWPAIVITGHDTELTRERARRLGAPILRKPIESAELLAMVAQAIGRDLDLGAE